LGPYEILSPLGAGGMGEVYRARDTRLHRDVAIKILPEATARDAAALARFEREARAVAALSHPHILEIHDFGREGDVVFAVTELLEGETLRQRLHGALPWRQAAEIAVSTAEGLAAAHSRGIVHRDLKPENIFLTSDGRVKLLDFGLARQERGQPGPSDPTIVTSTESGTLLGTVGYMSPEQVRGGKADARSDIFSLGCVIYEMVTGRRAFSGETPADTLVGILREDPKDPADLAPDAPESLARVVRRCLFKDPERRFQSARDLSFPLRDVLLPGAGERTPRRGRSRRILLSTAAVLALLASLLLLSRGSLTSRGAPPSRSLAVLPFTNARGDPEAQYFSDGMSESLINSLSQLPRLRVLARTTSFQYRGADPRRAGRELKVEAVVTGRVSGRGNRMVVQVDLIDVADGSQLWGRRFDEEVSDVFRVQEGIAQEISQSLLERLSPEEERRLAKRHTPDPEAYNLYLKGRYWWAKRSDEGFEKSIQFFEQAVLRDPKYAPAWVGLADAFRLLAFYGVAPPQQLLHRARSAAERALALDPALAEARYSLADALYQVDWDWERAGEEFRRAIALNRNYATGRQWYSNYLSLLGDSQGALREIRAARELDPLNLVTIWTSVSCTTGAATTGAPRRSSAGRSSSIRTSGSGVSTWGSLACAAARQRSRSRSSGGPWRCCPTPRTRSRSSDMPLESPAVGRTRSCRCGVSRKWPSGVSSRRCPSRWSILASATKRRPSTRWRKPSRSAPGDSSISTWRKRSTRSGKSRGSGSSSSGSTCPKRNAPKSAELRHRFRRALEPFARLADRPREGGLRFAEDVAGRKPARPMERRGPRPGGGDEKVAHVVVPVRRQDQAAVYVVNVEVEDAVPGCRVEVVDAGLLLRFAQRRFINRGVLRFHVASGLKPALELAVVAQEDARVVGARYDRAGRHVVGVIAGERVEGPLEESLEELQDGLLLRRPLVERERGEQRGGRRRHAGIIRAS